MPGAVYDALEAALVGAVFLFIFLSAFHGFDFNGVPFAGRQG
jgi:hypothetical protein